MICFLGFFILVVKIVFKKLPIIAWWKKMRNNFAILKHIAPSNLRVGNQ